MGSFVDTSAGFFICFHWTFRDFFVIPHGCSEYCWLLFHYLEFIFAEQRFSCCSSLPPCVPITHYSDRTREEPDTVGLGSALTFPKSYGAGGNQETLVPTSMLPCASDCFNRGI